MFAFVVDRSEVIDGVILLINSLVLFVDGIILLGYNLI